MATSVEDFEPLLEDQHNTARAYYLCVVGLVLFEAFLQLPDLLRHTFPSSKYMESLRQSEPKINAYLLAKLLSRDIASHSILRVYLHKVLTFPTPLPIVTTHHFANILRLGVFIGLNVLFGWNRIAFTTDYKVYGWLTIANAGLALLLSARLNILSVVLRVPSAALLIYHRWAGRAALVHATLHLGLTLDHHQRTGQLEVVLQNSYIQGGLVAFASLALMGLTSIGPIRRYLFEFFYYPHFLFLVFVAGAIVHATPAPEFLLPGLVLWGLDRVWRIYNNVRSVKVTSAEVLPGNVLKVKVDGVKPSRPNQFAWIGTSFTSFVRSHPFTIASASADGGGTFAIRGLGGDTMNLQTLAGEKPAEAGGTNVDLPSIRLRLDGPYGYGSLRWEEYPVVALVAGGIGITPAISIASHILHQNLSPDRPTKTRHISLFWSVRVLSHTSWFEEELVGLASLAASGPTSTSLDINIYISSRSQSSEIESSGSPSETKPYNGPGVVHAERSSVYDFLETLKQTRPGSDIALSLCGPKSLLLDGRHSAARLSRKDGLIFVEEEVFER